MTAPRYLTGVGLLVLIAALLAIGAWQLRRRWMPGWRGAPARLAESLLAITILVLTAEFVGSLGRLSAWSLILPLAAVGGAAAWVGRGTAGAGSLGPDLPGTPSHPKWGIAAGLGVAVVLLVQWGARSLRSIDQGMYGYDTTWYHLPIAARYLQEGSTTAFNFVSPGSFNPYQPANSELLHSVLALPFHRDLLSPLVNLGWLALALLAAWCLGRPRGRGHLTLIAVAVVLASPILASTQAGDASNDVVGLALLLGGVALVFQGDDGIAPLTLAGLSVGLAVGTKITYLAPAGGLYLAMVAISRGHRWRVAWVWAVAMLLGGGYWFLRNFVDSGSPMPSLRLSVGAVGFPSQDVPQTAGILVPIAHFITDPHFVASTYLPGLSQTLGRGWWAMLALASGGAVASFVVRPADARVRLLGAVAAISAIAYVFTPGTGVVFAPNVRYGLPSVAMGLVTLVLHPWFSSKVREVTVTAAVLVVLLVTEMSYGTWPQAHLKTALAVAAISSVAAAWLAVAPPRHIGRERLVAAAFAVVLLVAAAGWRMQEVYFSNRYLKTPDSTGDLFSGAPALLRPVFGWAQGVHGERIGIVNVFFQYPLYGADLTNQVHYIGVARPHGGFAAIDNCGAWKRAVNDDGDGYVVVGSRGLGATPEPGPPPEYRWIASDSSGRLIGSAGGDSGNAWVFRVNGRLDPVKCS